MPPSAGARSTDRVWPATTVKAVTSPRWVTGTPAYAGCGYGGVTPGTTSKATPACHEGERLFPASPEDKRVAAL